MNNIKAQPKAQTAAEAVKVVTHNGVFHADDVFACAAVMIMAGPSGALLDRPVEIARTRDAAVIEAAEIVIDVGGIHDPAKGRFDHHQRGGAGARANGVPFASVGLVWNEFGTVVVSNRLAHRLKPTDGYLALKVAAAVDRQLIQHIDARDCGYKRYEGYSVSDLITSMNPVWIDEPTPEDFDSDFQDACDVAIGILDATIQSAYAEVMAEEAVGQAMASMYPGGVVVLHKYAPWKSVVGRNPDAMFVVHPSATDGWVVSTVSDTDGKPRIPFPGEWAGLNTEKLSEVANIDGCVFCHPGRFIAGHKEATGAMAMASVAYANHLNLVMP